MLQANLAIVLTFITTLIDELGETENLSNAKLAVIIVAFVTVIFLFNYTLRSENNEMSNLSQVTKSLQGSLSMISSSPERLHNSMTSQANQLNNSIKSHANQLNNSIKSQGNQLQNSMKSQANQLQNSMKLESTPITMPSATSIPVSNNNNSDIKTSSPLIKESFRNCNNTTQRMSILFKNL